jgi:integrase
MSKRGRTSKEDLVSKAKIELIDSFQPMKVGFEMCDGYVKATFSKSTLFFNNDDLQNDSRIIRKFPIIYSGDGNPWDLGNSYLLYKFYNSNKYKVDHEKDTATITSIAHHLLAYLKWIENEKNKKPDTKVDIFYFPDEIFERVPYRYQRYLKRTIRSGLISPSTANARINAIVGFYRAIHESPSIIPFASKEIKSLPFEDVTVPVALRNDVGKNYIKKVKTTDLRIKVSKNNHLGSIVEEGRVLHPLNVEEQKILFKSLDEFGNRELQLICWVAIYTGARIQTLCTIRCEDIVKMYNDKPYRGASSCFVGQGTLVDVKLKNRNNKRYKLVFPYWLVVILYKYLDSNRARLRRGKSFYGNDLINYLFLNKNGSPYYTSKSEIEDRMVKYKSYKDFSKYTVSNGQAIRNLISRLQVYIKGQYPDCDFRKFSIHDLRSTFAVNYMSSEILKGGSPKFIVNDLKTLMGHSDISTTYRYVDYIEKNERIKKALDDDVDTLRS